MKNYATILFVLAALCLGSATTMSCSDARAQGPEPRVIIDTIAPPATDGGCPCVRPFKVLGSYAFGISGLTIENRHLIGLPALGNTRTYEITDVRLMDAVPSAPQFRVIVALYVNNVLAAQQYILDGRQNGITLQTGVVVRPTDVVEIGITNMASGDFALTGLRRTP